MTTEFKSTKLRELIETARAEALRSGVRRVGQRGTTYSLMGVKLTWIRPQEDKDSFFYWDEKSDRWYQEIFVKKRAENLPERLRKRGEEVFAYTYAHRSRFFDGGIGYLVALLEATKGYQATGREILKTKENFLNYLATVGEQVHLQAVLAVLKWTGREFFGKYLEERKFWKNFLLQTRQDSLERLTAEVKSEPNSKRLVTPSFVYPKIDQGLDVILSIPPYQFFQVLPGEKSEPISSVHFHRSLDASGGVQLDFHHDYDWLCELAKKTKRVIGEITVMAGDFHVYAAEEKHDKNLTTRTKIKDWLKAVTDGYTSGNGVPEKLLLEKPIYQRNARALFKYLT